MRLTKTAQAGSLWTESSTIGRLIYLIFKKTEMIFFPKQSKVQVKIKKFDLIPHVRVCRGVFLLNACMCALVCAWKLTLGLSSRGSIGALLPQLQERSETGSVPASAIILHHLLRACTWTCATVHGSAASACMDIQADTDDKRDRRAIWKRKCGWKMF